MTGTQLINQIFQIFQNYGDYIGSIVVIILILSYLGKKLKGLQIHAISRNGYNFKISISPPGDHKKNPDR